MHGSSNPNSKKMSRSGYSCCCGNHEKTTNDITRRQFVRITGTGALGTVALSGLSWSSIMSGQTTDEFTIQRQPLIVKPVFMYDVPSQRKQTSWRHWGGIQTEEDAANEIVRIRGELNTLGSKADFPVNILPVSGVRTSQELLNTRDLDSADLFLIYAAGGGSDKFDILNDMGKNIIFFCRHKSGPVYLWYEIISPRYLRKHTDVLTVKGIDEDDVVIDSQDELLWRMRALCGLKNTVNSGILAIGGPGAWSQPLDVILKLVKDRYKFSIQTVTYDDLGRLITEARRDKSVITSAKNRSEKYLAGTGIKLETQREYVENCFVLEDVFKRLMDKSGCRAITVNNCMGTIMPLAETTACLTLSLLNDAGYLAFCESDFVVIPSGILMANISGKPVFLNDPTYPHDQLITLAHCTAPRRMNGKSLEPARIMTHFESDYGAAPKVEMHVGQSVTNIMPDFAFKLYTGLPGKIVDNPMLDICRSQIDIGFECESRIVAEKMHGFHWITVYGDYLREMDYALKKIGIKFENLG